MQPHYIAAIEKLKHLLDELASRVENSVHAAVGAVENLSPAAAGCIIQNDGEIDRAEIAIEEECLKILALYQPVASDLRHVVTILKVNNEIERVGDQAVNIASRVEDMALYQADPMEKPDFQPMALNVCGMLKRSLDSLAIRDPDMAAKVLAMDDAVDEIHHDNYRKIRSLMERFSPQIPYYLDCLTISGALERIGDIATNISEDVIYLERGRIVRHHADDLDHK